MGKAALAKQRAIGLIGLARTDKLYDAGLIVLDAAEYEQLRARVADLEHDNHLLRQIVADSTAINTTAALVLKEAMTR